MFDRKSLVTQLGWQLALVLAIGTLLQMVWLFMHFRGAETSCKRRSKNPSVKRPIRSVAPE